MKKITSGHTDWRPIDVIEMFFAIFDILSISMNWLQTFV